MSSHRRKLTRLLTRRNYELTVNELGSECWSFPGCTDIWIHPTASPQILQTLIRQVQTDSMRRDPENTPEQARQQAVWERQEAERVERERADAARVAPHRLNGYAAYLTEPEIDAIEAHLIAKHQAERQLVRSMRHYPADDIRVG